MKAASECCCILLFLLSSALFKLSKGQGFYISLWASPSISDGVVCANYDVNFTCQMFNVDHTYQYQWTFGEEAPWIGNAVESRNFSDLRLGTSLKITCTINAQVNDRKVSGSINVVVSIGNIPQIKFHHVHDTDYGSEVQYFVNHWHGTELDLTATIVSISNLTSLGWTLPEEFYHNVMNSSDGNTTNTTLMIYKTTNLAGVYSLSAGNKCGTNSVKLEVYSGNDPIINFPYVTNNLAHKLLGKPFSLTATIKSTLNLTWLWSPPHPVPYINKTVPTRYGISTTFYLLENATLNDSGIYVLEASNKHGNSSARLEVQVTPDCPPPRFVQFQYPNFTTVEGYNATLTCSFDGYYTSKSQFHAMARLPGSQKPIELKNQPYSDCKCWVENNPGCSIDTDPKDCCRYEFAIHTSPHLKHNGTAFSCDGNFSKEDTSWMFVVPSPKVIRPPHDLSVSLGSTAVFTCDFEAATDNKISQIHWMFNGKDLAGCKRQQDWINCAITHHDNHTNYISSTLTIYPVKASNAGQYTCYCLYDIDAINVDGDQQVIESDHKSATLSMQSDSSAGLSVTVIVIVIIVSIIIIIGIVIWRYYHQRNKNYYDLFDIPNRGIPDDVLNQYMIRELYGHWKKLGRALELSTRYLEDDIPEELDPAERFRTVLQRWNTTADDASVAILNNKLEELGLEEFIPHAQ